MFSVHYNKTTGEVVQYQEGPERDATPAGCETVCYSKVLPGMFNEHGICLMKVVDGKLTWKSPHEIPEPLPNPPNRAV